MEVELWDHDPSCVKEAVHNVTSEMSLCRFGVSMPSSAILNSNMPKSDFNSWINKDIKETRDTQFFLV